MVFNFLSKLWKTEDASWLSKRQNDWNTLERIVYSQLDHELLNVLREYFIYGKGANRVRGSQIFLLTPFESPEDAKYLYDLEIIDRQTRENLLLSYFRVYACVDELDWYREHSLHIANGIYGNNYNYSFSNGLGNEGNKSLSTPSIEPEFLSSVFVHDVRRVLQGRQSFSGFVFLIDLFVFMLGHVNDNEDRLVWDMCKLFEDAVYTLEDPCATNIAKKTAFYLLENKKNCLSKFVIDADEFIGKRYTDSVGGWLLEHYSIDAYAIEERLVSRKSEIKDTFRDVPELSSFVANVFDSGGKCKKVDAGLLFKFDNSSWLPFSLKLYRSNLSIDYHALHFGCESDIHLFSITSGGGRRYIRFYLDDFDDNVSRNYRSKFVGNVMEWKSELPKKFLSYLETRKLLLNLTNLVKNEPFETS